MLRRSFQQIFLVVCLVVPFGSSAADQFDEIVVFGDSLSDNGTLAAVPGFEFLSSPFLPFDDGFSNGPRAVEILADGLGLNALPAKYLSFVAPQGTNFAVAGARSVALPDFLPIDLPDQVDVFLASRGMIAPVGTLYVIFIGGNDVRDARDEVSQKIARRFVRNAVDGIDDAIRRLATAGAQNFLVANVPDIGAIPETGLIQESEGDKQFSRRATNLTHMFNGRLRGAIDEIRDELGVEILEFDTFNFIRAVIAEGEELGFSNTEDACFFTNVFLETGVPVFHPECNNGLNFDQFVFFDEIHSTAAVNALAGQAMLELIRGDGND